MPLRVAFVLNRAAPHRGGICFDAADIIGGVELAQKRLPLAACETAMLVQAKQVFAGEVQHAPSWGEHWYGCSTRPWSLQLRVRWESKARNHRPCRRNHAPRRVPQGQRLQLRR